MSHLIGRAESFTIAAHSALGQVRKYTDEPYHAHCDRVAKAVADAGLGEHVVAAAWLHDVVEDTAIGIDMIRSEFGGDVAQLVAEVTNPSKRSDGPRAVRKQIDLEHLARSSCSGASIKLADIADNAPSIGEFDPGFARVWVPEKTRQLDVLRHGDQRLWQLAARSLCAALPSACHVETRRQEIPAHG